jgi:hypothetical protein
VISSLKLAMSCETCVRFSPVSCCAAGSCVIWLSESRAAVSAALAPEASTFADEGSACACVVAAGGCAGSVLAGGCAGLVVDGGCVGLAGACAGVGSAGCAVGAAGDAGDAGAGSDGEAGDAGDAEGEAGDAGDAGAAVAAAVASVGDVLAGDDVIGCAGAALGDAVALALAAGAAPLMAAANAVRLARAVVSFAFVSSSIATAAAAFDGAVPEVPVGLGSLGVAALVAPVAGESASSSLKILSAAAASVAHFAEPDALAVALVSLAVIFSMELTRFFSSAICAFAFPVTALLEMLFRAALASCRCCCGVP